MAVAVKIFEVYCNGSKSNKYGPRAENVAEQRNLSRSSLSRVVLAREGSLREE
jgi:hypothetical protein